MIIAHLTSVHPRDDPRILLKQCRSLAAAGHQVFLVVADGLGEEERHGVRILDAGRSRGRLGRMAHATRRVMTQALALDADIYHLHDPELLPAALAIKRSGGCVVFDAHEDVPRQILSKSYLPAAARRPAAAAVGMLERFVCRRIDAVVAATPAIREKFERLGIAAIDICNFPIPGELEGGLPWSGKTREVCYVGSITAVRGIREVVAAMELSVSGARLSLAGAFGEESLRAELVAMPGWSRVDQHGFLSRAGVRQVLARSVAGLVTLHPVPAYIQALPTKMFEYMAAGLPVIASDFPLWREIVEGHECGLCVDPRDPQAIAAAIDRLAGDQDAARRMGDNGRRAVAERYNWDSEEKKLLALYGRLVGETGMRRAVSGGGRHTLPARKKER